MQGWRCEKCGYPPRSVIMLYKLSLRFEISCSRKESSLKSKSTKSGTKGGIAPSKANSLSVLVETRVCCKGLTKQCPVGGVM